MSTGMKTRKTAATRATIPSALDSGNVPAYHTLKRVEALEEFPGADDVLIVADEAGEFHFHGLQECGVTTFFLLSRILKGGTDEDILRPRSEGRVYFRDVKAGTPRAKRVLPNKSVGAKVTFTPSATAEKPTAKPKAAPKPAPVATTTAKRGRGRPKGSTNKKKSA